VIRRSYVRPNSFPQEFFSDSVPASVRTKLEELRDTTAWARENCPWAPHEQYRSVRLKFLDEANVKESLYLKLDNIIVLGQYYFPVHAERLYGTSLFRMAVPDSVVKDLVSRLREHVKLDEEAPLLRSSAVKCRGILYHMTTVYMNEDYIKVESREAKGKEINYASFRSRLVSEEPEDIHASGELKVFLKYGGAKIEAGGEILWQIGLVPKRLCLGEKVGDGAMDGIWDCVRDHTAIPWNYEPSSGKK
jgi:hypothetical protein